MPLKTQRDEQPTLNLTPMIDVMFQLIIFFVVGTKFAETERNVELKIPQVSQGANLPPVPQRRVVNVYRDGNLTLDGQDVSLKQLTNQLAAARSQYQDLGVLVRGDGTGEFQRVAEVLAACKQAGVSELGISVGLAARENPADRRR